MSWTRCYEAATEPEAHVVRGFLERRGVPCLLRPLGPTIYSRAFGTEVLVPPEWGAVAARWLAGRRRPPRGVVPLAAKRMRA